MKVLITGAGGQLGWELKRSAPAGSCVCALTKEKLDVTNRAQVESCVRELRPQIVINAAAYTAVDQAEAEPGQAYAVNAIGAENLARVAAAEGLRLVHLSTDFIFNGLKSTPYLPSDIAEPLSVYGASKLEGESRVLSIAANDRLVVRTSWVYSVHGRNFVKTILRLLEERPTLDVIADQIGTPTWARSLAEALWEMAPRAALCGVYHYTDAGVASWYDLALAVREYGIALGLVRRPASIKPVRTTDYPLSAKRPAMSMLDKTATWEVLERKPLHWRQALRLMLSELVWLRRDEADKVCASSS
jgi:dTDP-4-dehydrorhamnose reductase